MVAEQIYKLTYLVWTGHAVVNSSDDGETVYFINTGKVIGMVPRTNSGSPSTMCHGILQISSIDQRCVQALLERMSSQSEHYV
jgi:hypothetical protein